jgi:hypothetical protein
MSLQVCLSSTSKREKWYIDSGCSRHMTGDSSNFISLQNIDGGDVTFGDNKKGKIVGIGKIGKEDSPIIDGVLLVKGLKHNLMSVSQLCDKGYRVIFEIDVCIVQNIKDAKILFEGKRYGNIYVIDLDILANKNAECFMTISNDAWIWHRRLGHASMKLLSNLNKEELVRGLPDIKFEKDKICDSC